MQPQVLESSAWSHLCVLFAFHWARQVIWPDLLPGGRGIDSSPKKSNPPWRYHRVHGRAKVKPANLN